MRNQIVSHERWLKARLELLADEKEFTRRRDALTRRRLAMPWERVEKSYEFEGPNGALSLADLFDGRSQLIVYHFMFGPDWKEGCKPCSFWADNFDGTPIHLNHRDVTLAAVSRAPFAKLDARVPGAAHVSPCRKMVLGKLKPAVRSGRRHAAEGPAIGPAAHGQRF